MTQVPRRTLNILSKVLSRKTQVIRNRIATPHRWLSPIDKKVKDVMDKSLSKVKIKEKGRRRIKRKLTMGAYITCLSAYLIAFFGAPDTDDNGKALKDDLSDKPKMHQFTVRAFREFVYYALLLSGPTTEMLLPDLLEHPYKQPKYTLVLELTDVLVHPEWSYSGWRFNKRPLFQHFLDTLKDSYEIVVYTAEHGRIVFPIIDAIDPNNIIAYRLVRGTTRFTGRNHVKKLNNLNRDLSKVICVDWNSSNVRDNPDNLFCIKRWHGNSDDTSLLDLAAFLKTVADSKIEDVREVLKYYSKYDDPIAAFREKQKRFIEELENEAAHTRVNRLFNLSSLFKFSQSEK